MCRVLFAVGSGISNLASGLGQRRHWILFSLLTVKTLVLRVTFKWTQVAQTENPTSEIAMDLSRGQL